MGYGWGGGGPAVDSAGNIYLSTGNGTFDVTGSSKPAYGDSVLRLNPSTGLSVADYFTPFEQANLDTQDLDLASVPKTNPKNCLMTILPHDNSMTRGI